MSSLIIHDISVTVTPNFVTWENSEVGLRIETLSEVGESSPAHVSLFTLGAHTGTHLDAPKHFIAGGAPLETLDLKALVGPVWVTEIPDAPKLGARELEAAGIPSGTERLILKTENTRRRLLADEIFHRDYVGIAPDGAQWLVDHGITLVGLDYLSVGAYGEDNIGTHRILLGAEVVLVESLDLTGIAPGGYFLAALPPKFAHAEASPCRVILIEGIS